MEKFYLEHMKTEDFFNQVLAPEWLEEIWNLNEEKEIYKFLEYKCFNMGNSPRNNDNFYLLKIDAEHSYKDIYNLRNDKTLPKELQYISTYPTDENSKFLFLGKNFTHINDVAECVAVINRELGKDILATFHEYASEDSKEKDTIIDNIVMQQASMKKYLNDNNVIMKVFPIDFDLNDNEALHKWYAAAESFDQKNHSTIKEFHYSTPFIMDGNYVIQNTGSSHYYIYKEKNENSGCWYRVERNFAYDDEQFAALRDNPNVEFGELLYYSHEGTAVAIAKGCNEWNLILELENGKMIKALPEVTTLNLLQNAICQELYGEDKLSYITSEPITLEHEVECHRHCHYRKDHMNSIEAFFDLISQKELNGNKMQYYSADYVLPEHLDKPKFPETQEEKQNIESSLRSDKYNYTKLNKCNDSEKSAIFDYIDKHIAPLCEEIPTLNKQLKAIENQIKRPMKTHKLK
jgi:hypothetical protein